MWFSKKVSEIFNYIYFFFGKFRPGESEKHIIKLVWPYYDTVITRSKLLCVNSTVLTGIDVDLDSDSLNYYAQKSPPIILNPGVKGRRPRARSHLGIIYHVIKTGSRSAWINQIPCCSKKGPHY